MTTITDRPGTPVGTTHSAPARPEDEKLAFPKMFGYGLQHILAMLGGVIAVPLIIGGAAGLTSAQIAVLLSCGLFVSGCATLLQTLGVKWFGSQLPLVQGISFASVSTLLTIVAGKGEPGVRTGFGAVIVAAVICLVLVPFFAQVIRLFPPIVTGSIITVIGLSLMPTAAGWITGQATINGQPNPSYASGANLALGVATLVIVLVLSKIKATARTSILLGLVLGTVLALITGQAHWHTSGAAIIALPRPFAFGSPIFTFGSILAMVVVMVVIMVETTADILAVGEVVGTEVDARRVADGLRADMAASAIAPVFNSFPATAFAQNVGLVALSGIKSRYAVAIGGGILAVLGLSPLLAAVLQVIPNPVLGGVGIALFGSVAASGIRTLSKVNYQSNNNLLIVAVAITFGVLPDVSESFWQSLPTSLGVVFGSGISATAIVAVLLNLLFNELLPGKPENPSDLSGAPALLVQDAEMAMLREGEPA